MSGRRGYRRMRVLLIGAAVAAAVAPDGAGAAVTVGSTFDPGNNFCLEISNSTHLQTASPAGLYTVATAGVLTSWSYRASNQTPGVKLKVARQTGPDAYFIVGGSGEKTAVANQVNTYTDVSIAVQPGDVLGLWITAGGACGSNAQTGFVSRILSSDPGTGQTMTFPPQNVPDDYKLDISATLEADADGDGLGDETEDADDDTDGVPDVSDNCASVVNPGQANLDGDAQGDACDSDDDGDGIADVSDNCANVVNPGQANLDGDALGNACDADDDGDGIADVSDNCASVANAGQADADGDAQGDACDATPTPVAPVTPVVLGPVTLGVPPPGVPLRDATKPVLGALTLSSSAFQAAGAGPAFAARVGTRVTFTVSEVSAVRFTIQQRATGRRVGSSCQAQAQANRTRRSCTRWVAVRGSFTIPAQAGRNAFSFRGRTGSKKLKPGSYRLESRATDAAQNTSNIVRRTFRVVK